ncbi:MAG: SDR family NAD(P)-dependent oxidoreductase [Nitrososphaeraceae archaeon]
MLRPIITRIISFISASAKSNMVNAGIALVTGSSTGIGFETALALARRGIHTFATMREPQKDDTIKGIAREENLPLDVLGMDVGSL